jgi:excisionase family DNA binding protein
MAELLKVPEFAKALRTSNSWVYGKIKSGEIAAYRLPGNRLLRIPPTELLKFQPAPRWVLPAISQLNLIEIY